MMHARVGLQGVICREKKWPTKVNYTREPRSSLLKQLFFIYIYTRYVSSEIEVVKNNVSCLRWDEHVVLFRLGCVRCINLNACQCQWKYGGKRAPSVITRTAPIDSFRSFFKVKRSRDAWTR